MRSRVSAFVLALAAALTVADPSPGAVGASGPGGRLFTLLGADEHGCDPVGVYPDGSLLVADDSPPRVWRVGLDGVRTPVAALPESVQDIAPDGPSSFVAVARSSRRILRVDLAAQTTSVIVDLPGSADFFERVIALDDGSLVADNGSALWRIVDGKARVVVPGPSGRALITDVAPLGGGAFAYVEFMRDRIVRVERNGRRTVLAHLPPDSGPSTTLASHGDELVALISADEDGVALTHTMRFHGSRQSESLQATGATGIYGNGDGYRRLPLARPSSAWLGGDGELVFRDDECSVRALVPPSSARARIVLLPSTWRSFPRGRIRYLANGAGQWRLTVRQAGGRTSHTTTGTTSGGLGTIRLPSPVPKGVFDVQLILTTPPGGVVQASGRFVTRDRLRMGTARRAIGEEVVGGEGDGGDGWGTELGHCTARSRREVACRVTYYRYNPDESNRGTCRGWARAWLRPDGVRVSDKEVRCPV
ncbi:hypothetical protein OJ997_06935 [Solirubrobacter phytolaccae]|uniref:Uncharacterized protein n=1 Tax=Solirubrobacter phytolaccae TaxID=1404360 RepID=A0A9X3N7V6_9ACTN|nr:hypothetical protein [Solirubrobacter phytolaccae]MDA0180024.1 hypothetical protein [Solirubrobacter phytolaccae]